MGIERCLRARMNHEKGVEDLIKNAYIVATRFKAGSDLMKVVTSDGTSNVVEDLPEGEDNEDGEEISGTGVEVFNMMAARKYRPTKKMLLLESNFKRTHTSLREGIVSKYLTTHNFI